MKIWLRALLLAVLAFTPCPPRRRSRRAPAEIAAYRGLHAAAANGDTAEIERLVKAGARLEARDGHSRTPLHVAAFMKQAGRRARR